jgi:hypothetical protein
LLLRFNLDRDPFEQSPEIVSTSLSLDDFYRHVLGSDLPPEQQVNTFDFPVHIGDSNVANESQIFPKLPAMSEDFKFHFRVSNPDDTTLTFRLSHVDFPHKVLLNGQDSHLRLCKTGTATAVCPLKAAPGFLRRGVNSLVILNNPCASNVVCGWKDDYVIWSITSNDDQSGMREESKVPTRIIIPGTLR